MNELMNDISQTSKNCIFHDILSKDMDKELDKNWTYVIFSVLKRRITMVPGRGHGLIISVV